ncbi:putative type IIS restriction /modification enzyme, N-terminal half [Candidatus Burkholderia verschuerenii]|uniref:Putative type IIS restriction /modification enzyme, N-terminal half n=1 Tax=Candidatus Burkholderia verschuerenii TaxID=242163 RepID=A0A0L0MGG1_9BURK|nr:putative type IIS restriction /modification enzyme, N-terminal half [Candidatus Burkholderia verschuerenii]
MDRVSGASEGVRELDEPLRRIASGDRVIEDKDGKRKHDFPLGGRGRSSFEASSRLHELWRRRREMRRGFADRAHPFVHQGQGKPYLHKMFLELSHALLRPQGRLGMIVPGGILGDKGSTELRTLFFERCDWQWLFGFENRAGIFDIHRSFRFCVLIVQKGGETHAMRAAFMHRDAADWQHAERHAMAYPRARVEAFSPRSKAILEIGGARSAHAADHLR